MANIPFLDGFRSLKYMEATGDGSDMNPFLIRHQNEGLTDTQLRAAPLTVNTGLSPLTDTQLRAAPIPVNLPGGTVTPALTASSTTGTIAAGAIEVSIAVVGSTPATVLGVSVPSGASVEWRSPPGKVLDSISYDASGSQILISEVR